MIDLDWRHNGDTSLKDWRDRMFAGKSLIPRGMHRHVRAFVQLARPTPCSGRIPNTSVRTPDTGVCLDLRQLNTLAQPAFGLRFFTNRRLGNAVLSGDFASQPPQ